jgi:RNA polymerase sigma-70 factor, ECF subfamily
VGELLDRVHAARPALQIDEEQLAAHLAGLVAGAPDEAAAIAALHVPDVALVLACAAGDADALAALEREYFAQLHSPLSKLGLDPSGIDETLQVMREELLAQREGKPPRILGYGGRGHLQGWLRAVAARTGLRVIRKAPRHTELDDRRHAPLADDLELAYMKKTYGEVFQRAFRVALDGLAADDRLLLKQRFRHHLTVDELGAMHGVHASTISRWVTAARDRLVKATRSEMMRELGVSRDDVSSILRLIESELEITLSSGAR